MKTYHYLVLLLLLLAFSSCNNNTDPNNADKIEIIGKPITIEININPDSLQIEQSPVFSVDYSSLKLKGVNIASVKYSFKTVIN